MACFTVPKGCSHHLLAAYVTNDPFVYIDILGEFLSGTVLKEKAAGDDVWANEQMQGYHENELLAVGSQAFFR